MPTWTKQKFKNFVQLQRGFDLPKNSRVDGEYPVVASTSITGYHHEYKVKAPCVTTGRSGALGEVLHINQDCWPLNTTLWVKDFKGNDPKFVYYKLKTLGLEKFNAGAGVPTLNRNHLDEMDISFPQKADQQKIASIISTYDDLIENNEKRIKILEEMAQRLYTEWFVKFKFPGHEKIKMVDTQLGKIPQGWKLRKLGSVIDVIGGLSYKNEFLSDDSSDVPLITMGFVHPSNPFNQKYTQYYKGPYKSSNKVKNGDLALATRDVTSERNILGSPILVPKFMDEAIVATNMYKVINISYLSNQFLYLLFRSNRFRKRMIGFAHGTNILMIVKDDVLNYEFICPDEDIIFKLNPALKMFLEEIEIITAKNMKLSQIRDLLIPQLVTGKRELN